jgi:ethanolamine utilization protein EutP (predicted NTPase)
MERKEYTKAVELLNAIPPDRPEYLFAQHSAAVALLAMDRPADAVTCLQNCITEETAGAAARAEIVNRSYLLLGYVLYENLLNEDKSLSKAVAMLRQIGKQSIYHDEAQLALGWSAIKAQQFNDCVTSGSALLGSKNRLLHFEGSLIAAYGYMMQQKYSEAKDILTAAAEKIDELQPVSEDSVAREKQLYLDTRAQYDFLAKKVAECAQKQQTGVALQENASLHGQQRDQKKKIDASIAYFDAYNKNLFLTRNYGTIKQDITYMLAVVSKRGVSNESFQKATKVIEKEKNIDKEIEKLKGEMDKIENKNK